MRSRVTRDALVPGHLHQKRKDAGRRRDRGGPRRRAQSRAGARLRLPQGPVQDLHGEGGRHHRPIRGLADQYRRAGRRLRPDLRRQTAEQSPSARVTRFTLVDVVIVIAVVFAISSGYRRGFWLSLAQYAGLVLGVVIGAALAPVLMDAINVTGASIRSLGAVLILIVLGAIGSSVGYWVGEPIRLRLLAHPHSGRVDSVAGAIFSALAVLSVSWFLGLSLARLPSPQLSSAIQRSSVLRALDGIAPRPPGFLARVEAIIAGVNFAPVFSGLEPLGPSPQPLPASIDTAGVRNAESETLKIQGYGCGGIVFGSGFPVGPGLVLTNAHVVAGP